VGAVAVRVCRRVPWTPGRRTRFLAAQFGLAAAYAAVWVVSVSLVFTVVDSLAQGRVVCAYLQSWALQWTVFSGFMIYGTIASVCYTREIALRLRAEQARAERLETLRTRAELEALRAQLNPHFVFNTLHSVMALVRTDAVAAEAAIERLAGLLRYVLGACSAASSCSRSGARTRRKRSFPAARSVGLPTATRPASSCSPPARSTTSTP